MTIREELLNAGFTSEYIDESAKEQYLRKVDEINRSKKKFSDTKIGRFLCTDWAEYLINKVALYYYEKEQTKHRKLPEFTGDRNNPVDVWEYNARNGIMPVETIDNEDGTFTHKYEDGTVVTIKITLTGIIDDEMIEALKKNRRRILADYLNMNEEELIAMSESEIESLVKKNEVSKKIKKVLRLDNNIALHKKED